MSSTAASTLRAITYRLTSTPPTHLPALTPHLASSLLDSASLLSSPASTTTDSASSVILHKYKTLLTTHLNSKHSSTRLTAVVLIKTTLELGGWEMLQSSAGVWVRGLLAILGKPADPPGTKVLVVMALTRVFGMTQEYATLVREITTPSLPAFVTACLGLVAPKGGMKTSAQVQMATQLLPAVLQSFRHLLPRHPTIFRTFLSQIRAVLLPLLAPTPSNNPKASSNQPPGYSDPKAISAARALYPLLPLCAPKSASAEEWSSALLHLLTDAHGTSSLVFRAVVEEWTSFAGAQPQVNGITASLSSDVTQADPSATGLPVWTGIHAGCERLTGLLSLIKHFITSSTALPVSFPLARVADLFVRVTSVTPPFPQSSGAQSSEGMRHNTQIGKEEREGLFSELPIIHAEATEVMDALFARFEGALMPMSTMLLDQITWVLKHDKYNAGVRLAAYKTVARIMKSSGTAFTKDAVAQLGPLIKACCEDIIPSNLSTPNPPASTTTAAQNGKPAKPTLNADTFLQTTKPTTSTTSTTTPLATTALHLLSTALYDLPACFIPQSLRALMDRTAVLSSDKHAMLASVLNPPSHSKLAKVHSSILPLLARAHPNCLEVEGLVRPRMPVLKIRYGDEGGEEEMEWDEDEDEMADVNGDDEGAVDGRDQAVEQDVMDVVDETSPTEPTQQPSPKKVSTQTVAPTAAPVAKPRKSEATTTPSAPHLNTPNQGSGTRKRASPEVLSTTSDAKRARLEVFDAPTNPLEATPDRGSAAVPITVTMDEPSAAGSEAADSGTATTAAELVVPAVLSVESDDDDFEIPELNMDPDTEDEDEDEDVDDEDELGQP